MFRGNRRVWSLLSQGKGVSFRGIFVEEFWKLYDTLIILDLISFLKWFRLFIHNQTSMYAARVLSSRIRHCSTCFQRDVEKVFLRISRELWVGVNWSKIVVKSLNQVNKSWVNKEAFDTVATLPGTHSSYDHAYKLVYMWNNKSRSKLE